MLVEGGSLARRDDREGGSLDGYEPSPMVPHDDDVKLKVQIDRLGKYLVILADWYRRCGDFSVNPGAAVLRHVSATAHSLGNALWARADDIDTSDPPPAQPRTVADPSQSG
jgi:hypothetical protein